jgi:hypothetical protein
VSDDGEVQERLTHSCRAAEFPVRVAGVQRLLLVKLIDVPPGDFAERTARMVDRGDDFVRVEMELARNTGAPV